MITINEKVVYTGNNPELSYHTIKDVVEMIATGVQKDIVMAIRSELVPLKKDELKRTLKGIMFSGKFNGRGDSSLEEHSGFICLDFDKIPKESMQGVFSTLKNDKYTHICFVSPSGNGFKVVVKIPKDKDKHVAYFNGLKNYYNSSFFDITSKNLSRVCFMSYDPNIVFNENSEEFVDAFEETFKKNAKPYETNKTINILLKWWSTKFGLQKGFRNNNVYILAMKFNEYGVDESKCETIFADFTEVDFPYSEIAKIIKSAYSKKEIFNTKWFDDNNILEEIDTSYIKSSKENKDFKSLLALSFVNLSDKIEHPPIALSIGTVNFKGNNIPISFGTMGNFSCLVGASKSKKTFFKSLLISSYIGGDSYKHTGPIKSHRSEPGIVLDFDTEQSQYHAQRVFKRTESIVGSDVSDFYKPYCLRRFTAKERLGIIEYALYDEYRGQVKWVSIDGISDLVEDFNDLKESSFVIQKVMKWTEELNIHLNTIIHSNPNSPKPTGHLGTAILKKAESVCTLSQNDKNDSFVDINFPFTRGYQIKPLMMGVDENWLPYIDGSEF